MDVVLEQNFPEGFKPNEPQEVILDGIAQAMARKKKFIIINAPTGSGKSFIAKTLANYSRKPDDEFVGMLSNSCRWGNMAQHGEYSFGAAILTCTKSLQDQYSDLFKDGCVLKGKVNYECGKDNNCLCDSAPCALVDSLKDNCWRKRMCPYLNARFDAASSRCSFFNYSMYLSLPEFAKYRQFLVCDECSELEDVIVNEYTLEVECATLSFLLGSTVVTPDEGSSDSDYYEWLGELNKKVANAVREISGIFEMDAKRKRLSKEETKRLRMLNEYAGSLSKLLECWDDTEWFKIHSDKGITFMPYQVDKLAQRIFNYAETVILMSATIVNVSKFASILGIDDYHYIDAPSVFDPARGYITPVSSEFRPNYKNKEDMIPKMAKFAKGLCEHFAGKKGIIHTNSFDIQKSVMKEVGKDARFLFRRGGVSNEQLLDAHRLSSEPTVLVSPSMTHGVDLKGDLGEFQIIMKAPYPPLSNPRIKRKFKEDKEWYVDKMLSTLIQACGRCNRTKDDLSITFILDYNAYEAIMQNLRKLPKYFGERLSEKSKNRFKELAAKEDERVL